jgi:hypothetical protein
MDRVYEVSFLTKNQDQLGSLQLGKIITQNTFWNDVSFILYSKPDFIAILKSKIDSADINSIEFSKYTDAMSEIAKHVCFAQADAISVDWHLELGKN